MHTWTPPTILRLRRFDFSDMPPVQRRVVIAGLIVSATLFLSGLVAAGAVWKLVRQFPRAPFTQPSRLYSEAPRLAPGQPITADEIAARISDQGYRKAADGLPLRRGTWRRRGDHLEIHLRRFTTPEGPAGGVPVEIDVRGGRVARLAADGRPVDSLVLEPALLASFYGSDVEERRPVRLAELPDHVVKAVLAAEDGSFYSHPGISVSGMVRALWVNLRGGALQQGGSTVTQQLVKNLYLSNRRTLGRKAKEALIAVILELRYAKRQILEAYLNEIYWGHSGAANLIGLGAASHAYFSKDPGELTLPEAATLAAMIRAPTDYSPVQHPDKALVRRNWVLHRMRELGWISPEQEKNTRSEPLMVDPDKVEVRPLAPYFAKAAAAEARDRFGLDDLADGGYQLYSTLGWREQRQAEAAVSAELASLGRGGANRRRGEDPLQAALISVDPRDGSIRSWVGGRSWSESQFDRVSQARRQAGSAFKPVIYAAAFSEAVVTPATLLRDSPIVVRVGNDRWQPQNYDRGFRGWVTVRSALEQSLNIPTVRLALQVGLARVIGLAHDMGIEGALDPVPSLALGSFELSPYEMAEVYATLASGGLRIPLHGLAAVRDRAGERILDADLPSPRRVMPAQTAYEVTSILQGAVDHGTGAGVRGWGLRDRLAGKTGTTNDRRDSWFAGYAPNRVTVVWVGYDDNARTRLSGARAALPLWSRFMNAVRPPGGYPGFALPAGMQTVTIDPTTGQLATADCPYRVTEILPDWQVPVETCLRHQAGAAQTWADMSLGGAPFDPATGRPATGAGWDPYHPEDDVVPAGGAVPGEDISLEGDDPAAGPDRARTFAPWPVDSAEIPAGSAGSSDGSILIRPAQKPPQREAPPPPPSPPPG